MKPHAGNCAKCCRLKSRVYRIEPNRAQKWNEDGYGDLEFAQPAGPDMLLCADCLTPEQLLQILVPVGLFVVNQLGGQGGRVEAMLIYRSGVAFDENPEVAARNLLR